MPDIVQRVIVVASLGAAVLALWSFTERAAVRAAATRPNRIELGPVAWWLVFPGFAISIVAAISAATHRIPDQRPIAAAMALGAFAAGVYGLICRGYVVSWDKTGVESRLYGDFPRRLAWADLVSARYSAVAQAFIVKDLQGRRLSWSPMMAGAARLAQEIERRRPDLFD